jgi:hypothetical protein
MNTSLRNALKKGLTNPLAKSLLYIPLLLTAGVASADPFFFSTGSPDGLMAMASRPDSGGKFEIESADDFVLTQETNITSATFTGLLQGNVTVGDIKSVNVEIYRVFPFDSDTARTPNVPTRVNSPSDVALATRESELGELNFSVERLASTFTATNSVQPGGIHPKPFQTTQGDGTVTGQEVIFNIDFATPFDLLADHYFFVPQVELSNGEFFWLSAPKPIVAPGTPFPQGTADLQAWTRDEFLDPDWLRVGTDIVGGTPAPTFNAAFSLSGATAVREPGSLLLMGLGGIAFGLSRRRVRGEAKI